VHVRLSHASLTPGVPSFQHHPAQLISRGELPEFAASTGSLSSFAFFNCLALDRVSMPLASLYYGLTLTEVAPFSSQTPLQLVDTPRMRRTGLFGRREVLC
jgi:hypothetical protein